MPPEPAGTDVCPTLNNPPPHDIISYLTSTLAPASSSFFFAASVSALFAPSSTGFGAPSTSALASARPRPALTSRTALMTAIFLSAGTEARITSNAVFASAAGAAAAPPAAAPAAAAATGAAALTPHLVSSSLTSSAVSMTVSLLSSSTMFAMSAMLPFSLVVVRGHGRIKLTACEPTMYFVVCVVFSPDGFTGPNRVKSSNCFIDAGLKHARQLGGRRVEQPHQLTSRRLERAEQPGPQNVARGQVRQRHP